MTQTIGSERVIDKSYFGRYVSLAEPVSAVGREVDFVADSSDGSLEFVGAIRQVIWNPFHADQPLVLEIEATMLEGVSEDCTVRFRHARSRVDRDGKTNPDYASPWWRHDLVRRGRWIIVSAQPTGSIMQQNDSSGVFPNSEHFAGFLKRDLGEPVNDFKHSPHRGEHADIAVIDSGLGTGMVISRSRAAINLVERSSSFRIPLGQKSKAIQQLGFAMLEAAGMAREHL